MITRAALAGLVCAISLAFGTGCAQKGLYEWGSYEDDLLQIYESPGSERAFAEHLQAMIVEARKAGRKTPPGVAAEYGFLQYQAGRPDEAIEYFGLERTNWPESAMLMTRLIDRIEAQQAERGGDSSAALQTAEETSP